MAAFMAGMDALVVTTALPTIHADLGAATSALSWTVAAYALGFAAVVLAGVALGDRYGRRRVFLFPQFLRLEHHYSPIRKYRQTLAALSGQLTGTSPAALGNVTVLGTPPGAAPETAFTAAFGGLATATRARHLSALRSALARRPAPPTMTSPQRTGPLPGRNPNRWFFADDTATPSTGRLRGASYSSRSARRNPSLKGRTDSDESYRAGTTSQRHRKSPWARLPGWPTPRAQVLGYPAGDHAGAGEQAPRARAQAGRILRPDPAG
jgi:Major Facilitator Superfamily